MKKLLKIVGITLLAIVLSGFVFVWIQSEPLPEGNPSVEADRLAEQMMGSLNYQAWQDTETVSWTFKGGHHYEWNKAEDIVKVKWDSHEVTLNTKTQSGIVANGQNYSAEEIDELTQTAIDYFNNDSFWLCAPFKAFDPGTERSIVTLSGGQTGLKVTYNSGGSTPGDSYVWILNENHQPTAVKMWVSILPIGGMEFTWENYQTLPSGALIAQDHIAFGFLNIELTDIQ
jgi:hypothetical protein